eukprot:6709589-Pyramimonas_sp.AAC.1
MMGRWRRDVLCIIADPIFWITLKFSHRARSPLTGFLAYNQKVRTNDELWRDGPAIVQLATGRAR